VELAELEAGLLLEDRGNEVLGGAGVGRGLEDDGGTGAQVAADGSGGANDEGQVGHAVVERGGHRDDSDVEVLGVARRVRGAVAAGLDGGGQPLGADVLDVRSPRLEGLDLDGVELQADYIESHFHRPDSNR
jgi:hypothetical protein